jgi:intracellular septation protein
MNSKISPDSVVRGIESASAFVFVIFWYFFDIKMATISIMVWFTFMALVAKIMNTKLTKMQRFTWLVSMGLGLVTVMFQNPLFIKLRSTIINCSLSFVVFVSHFIGDKTIFERITGSSLQSAPIALVRKINAFWAVYLLFVAALNYYVANFFSEKNWMLFKYTVNPAMFMVFLVVVFYSLRKFIDFSELQKRLEKK